MNDGAGTRVTARQKADYSRRLLAQFNVGQLRSDIDVLALRDFVAATTTINRLAETSPGFVWRLPDLGHATGAGAADRPRIINLSLWEDYQSLHNFVYRTAHGRFTRDRRRWFERIDGPAFVLWWVPKEHRPALEEGWKRLSFLRRHGPSPQAFSVRRRFDAHGRRVPAARSMAG